MRILEEEASEEEAAEVAQLASAVPDWQRKLAIELARSPRKSLGGKTLSRYLWAGAALAAALTMAVGIALWWQHVTAPERLLAEAYTHSRIFVLRMPGADFADVTPETHLRGGATGHESSQLLDARAGIERRLERAPNDAHWLQLEARADLLEENYGAAIDILDRLLDAGPVTAGLLADDAAAYF